MTEKEALGVVKRLIGISPSERILSAFGIVKSATEKQIPKKPIRQHEEPTDEEIEELVDLGFCGGNAIRCPNCNEYIVIDKLKYCMDCGQALDWRNNDD